MHKPATIIVPEKDIYYKIKWINNVQWNLAQALEETWVVHLAHQESEVNFIHRLLNTHDNLWWEWKRSDSMEEVETDKAKLIRIMIRNLQKKGSLYAWELEGIDNWTFVKLLFGDEAKRQLLQTHRKAESNYKNGKLGDSPETDIKKLEKQFIKHILEGWRQFVVENSDMSSDEPRSIKEGREFINSITFEWISLIEALKEESNRVEDVHRNQQLNIQ